jgi:hypothetical protein
MRRINISEAYGMGRAFRSFEQIKSGLVPATIEADLLVLKAWLKHLESWDILPRGKIQEHAQWLHSAVSTMLTQWRSEPLTTDRAYIVQTIFEELRPILTSEFAKLHIYFVPPIGIFSTEALLTEPEKMFSDDSARLPPETLTEIQEAGKCLGFSLPTATGFHLMRAVESILRHYYDVLSHRASRPTRGAMGVYLDEILKLHGVDTELHAALKQIKILYRDPIAHPEAILSMTDAISLMGVVQSAISRTLILTADV